MSAAFPEFGHWMENCVTLKSVTFCVMLSHFDLPEKIGQNVGINMWCIYYKLNAQLFRVTVESMLLYGRRTSLFKPENCCDCWLIRASALPYTQHWLDGACHQWAAWCRPPQLLKPGDIIWLATAGDVSNLRHSGHQHSAGHRTDSCRTTSDGQISIAIAI